MSRSSIVTATNRARSLMIDRLESRTFYSAATPTITGYFPDYEYSTSLVNTLVSNKFEGLTQVDYFSVLPTTTGLLPGTTVNGVSNTGTTTSGGYSLTGSKSQLNVLVADAHAAGVKVSVVIGGGGSQSGNLTAVVESNSNEWATFAASVTQFASTYKLDGVDLDWEPASLTGTDVANYGNLIASLRSANPNLILSAAVNSEKLQVSSGGTAYVLNATGMANLTNINVMAYDLQPGNVSPTPQAESDLAGWGTFATNNGITKTKIIFGMPFYGTSGTTWANTVADQYSQLIASYGSLPSPSANSVVISGTTWNYNGPVTIANKTAYSLDNGYGGVLAWEIGQDYFSGGAYDSTYSLLPQFGKAVAANTGTITGTVATTNSTPVAGETVYLDTNNNGSFDTGEPSAVTGSTGAYSFSKLSIGSYSVREVLLTGYTQTAPAGNAADTVSATAGGSVAANFTVAPPLVATSIAMVDNSPTTTNATQPLNFTITLSGGVPDGEAVSLLDASNGNAVVATAHLLGGTATFTVSAGTVFAGSHSLFAAYAGDGTYAASQSAALTQTVQVVVTSATVNGNLAALAGAQRSMVDSIVYTFSEPVNVGAGAFSIVLNSSVTGGPTGTVPDLTITAVNPLANGSSTQWAVTFSGAGTAGGSIADGVYNLSMNAAAVTSAANAAIASQARATDTFYRMYGDINGDMRVNNADYNLFLQTYNLKSTSADYLVAFDATGTNSKIGNADYNLFLGNYNRRFSGFQPTI